MASEIKLGQLRRTNLGVVFRVVKLDKDKDLVACERVDGTGTWESSIGVMASRSTVIEELPP